MLYITSNSSVLIIALHEIYGINNHMHNVCRRFAAAGLDVICPNLLPAGQVYSYAEAAEAHLNFMQNVGFDLATQRILSLGLEYRALYQKVFLVGFSVGATTAWLCSQDRIFDGAVGFYGSRIRNYTEVNPSCRTLLFFPRQEASFSVDLLLEQLAGKKHVHAERIDALHGFADPWSEYYCQDACEKTFKRGLQFILNQTDL